MKTMTCRQLGGACDLEFHAETFEEISELSRNHGMKMFEQKDQDHLKAMTGISELMKDRDAMEKWIASKRREFDQLPED